MRSGLRVLLGRPQRAKQLAFCAAIAAYLAALVFSLSSLPHDARLFPIIVLAIAGLLLVLKVLAEVSPRLGDVIEPDRGTALAKAPLPGERRAPLWLWLAATATAVYSFGFLVPSPIAVFVYLRFVARNSTTAAAVTAAATFAFLYFVFGYAMGIDLMRGSLIPDD